MRKCSKPIKWYSVWFHRLSLHPSDLGQYQTNPRSCSNWTNKKRQNTEVQGSSKCQSRYKPWMGTVPVPTAGWSSRSKQNAKSQERVLDQHPSHSMFLCSCYNDLTYRCYFLSAHTDFQGTGGWAIVTTPVNQTGRFRLGPVASHIMSYLAARYLINQDQITNGWIPGHFICTVTCGTFRVPWLWHSISTHTHITSTCKKPLFLGHLKAK